MLVSSDEDTRLFLLWDGPEGQNVEVLRANKDALDSEAQYSRYWSPE